MKTQTIRLLDIFVIGPFLLFVAWRIPMPTIFKFGLVVIGIATILYNWRNYRLNT